MFIKDYKFGSIKIDGRVYSNDVEVRWLGATRGGSAHSGLDVLDWWRKEPHLIDVDDVKRAVSENPEFIIIGTGAAGTAEVTKEAQEFIASRGIKLIIDKTAEAVKTFNTIYEKFKEEEGIKTRLLGLFHLTC